MSEARGSDSAGVGWDNRFLKIAQNPLVAYPMTLYPAIRAAAKHSVPLIGHTRQATTGAVTSENAHPFQVDNILFAHNGIIFNHEEFGKYEVDSESLIHGIKARDFSKYHGPIALVWIEDGKLHAFRKGNPLYRGLVKKAVYLASNDDYLKEIGCTRIKELSEGRIYKWKDASLENVQSVPTSKEHSYREKWSPKGLDTSFRDEGSWQEWDAQKGVFVHHYPRYDWNEHKTISLVPAKAEPDTLAEVDELEKADGPDNLCFECKQNQRLIASDYCAACVTDSFRRMGGC